MKSNQKIKNYENAGNRKNKLDDNHPQDHYDHSHNRNSYRHRPNCVIYIEKDTGEILTLKQAKNEARKVITVTNGSHGTTVQLGPARVKQLRIDFK